MEITPESDRYRWEIQQIDRGETLQMELYRGALGPLQTVRIPRMAVPALRVALAKWMEPIMAALALELGGVLERLVNGERLDPPAPPAAAPPRDK